MIKINYFKYFCIHHSENTKIVKILMGKFDEIMLPGRSYSYLSFPDESTFPLTSSQHMNFFNLF